MRFTDVGLSEATDDQLEKAQRRHEREAAKLHRREAERLHKAAAKLVALEIKGALRGVKHGRRVVIVGAVPHKAWDGATSYEHVPLAAERLVELGLDAEAQPVCGPLHPLLLERTTEAWRSTYRQCLLIRIEPFVCSAAPFNTVP